MDHKSIGSVYEIASHILELKYHRESYSYEVDLVNKRIKALSNTTEPFGVAIKMPKTGQFFNRTKEYSVPLFRASFYLPGSEFDSDFSILRKMVPAQRYTLTNRQIKSELIKMFLAETLQNFLVKKNKYHVMGTLKSLDILQDVAPSFNPHKPLTWQK